MPRAVAQLCWASETEPKIVNVKDRPFTVTHSGNGGWIVEVEGVERPEGSSPSSGKPKGTEFEHPGSTFVWRPVKEPDLSRTFHVPPGASVRFRRQDTDASVRSSGPEFTCDEGVTWIIGKDAPSSSKDAHPAGERSAQTGLEDPLTGQRIDDEDL